MTKITIEANDLKTLMTNTNTRLYAISIAEKMKLSKYSYTGAEAKEGIYYYFDIPPEALIKLRDIIINNIEVMKNLNIAFVIQLIKKIAKNEE